MSKLEFIGFWSPTKHLYKMLHSLVLDQTFLSKKANNLQLNHVNTMQGKSLLCMQYYIYVLAL